MWYPRTHVYNKCREARPFYPSYAEREGLALLGEDTLNRLLRITNLDLGLVGRFY